MHMPINDITTTTVVPAFLRFPQRAPWRGYFRPPPYLPCLPEGLPCVLGIAAWAAYKPCGLCIVYPVALMRRYSCAGATAELAELEGVYAGFVRRGAFDLAWYGRAFVPLSDAACTTCEDAIVITRLHHHRHHASSLLVIIIIIYIIIHLTIISCYERESTAGQRALSLTQ